MQLSRSSIWVIAAFITSAATLANTFFLTGQVQVFLYIIIAMCFAAFAIVYSDNGKEKNKSN